MTKKIYHYLVATALAMTIAFAGYTRSARSGNSSHDYYSKDQARHGKELYAKNCSKCHLENLKGTCPSETVSVSAPYVCANVRNTGSTVVKSKSFVSSCNCIATMAGNVSLLTVAVFTCGVAMLWNAEVPEGMFFNGGAMLTPLPPTA